MSTPIDLDDDDDGDDDDDDWDLDLDLDSDWDEDDGIDAPCLVFPGCRQKGNSPSSKAADAAIVSS